MSNIKLTGQLEWEQQKKTEENGDLHKKLHDLEPRSVELATLAMTTSQISKNSHNFHPALKAQENPPKSYHTWHLGTNVQEKGRMCTRVLRLVLWQLMHNWYLMSFIGTRLNISKFSLFILHVKQSIVHFGCTIDRPFMLLWIVQYTLLHRHSKFD